MATFTAVRNQKQTAGVLGWVLGYVSQRKKTVWEDRQLVSGCNCVARSALAEMLTTKERYQKTDGMMFYHFVQSIHLDDLFAQAADAEVVGQRHVGVGGEVFQHLFCVRSHPQGDELRLSFLSHFVFPFCDKSPHRGLGHGAAPRKAPGV